MRASELYVCTACGRHWAVARRTLETWRVEDEEERYIIAGATPCCPRCGGDVACAEVGALFAYAKTLAWKKRA
jgi:DNA-directed RNA polymerase subunit RPC12/RpoP